MKKLIALLLALVMVLGLVACGNADAPAADAPAADAPAADAPAADAPADEPADEPAAEPIRISFCHDNLPGEPVTMAGEYWAERLYEVSGGTMIMDTYDSSSAGAKTDLLDQMMAGDPIMVVGDGGFAADYGVADMSIVNGPYLFENWDQVTKLVESDLWVELKDKMSEGGMTVVSDNWWYGSRSTMSVEKLETPEDFKDLIIRVPNSSSYLEGFAAMGAAPTGMNLNEVYPALQQGMLDAVENPLSVLLANSFDEVCKYLALDKHIYQITFIVMNTDFFNGLTEEQQGWLLETGKEAAIYQNEKMLEAEAASIAMMEERGVEVTEVDFAAFAEAAKSFYTESTNAQAWSDGLYDKVIAILNG